ncbi:phosphopantetheine-binding protein [Rhodococcoides fascians]|uniref:phosphopantetheine-binding protein n=1 Tax=Rhodococcoides fascians TaxID=1828 RepID=UPI001D889C70|nr:phosphopantetheine-binding protein [Rhodococcus fascians]CAH0244567.1 hypothetical protein SRABI91_02974 [Rhodococcus fascians]
MDTGKTISKLQDLLKTATQGDVTPTNSDVGTDSIRRLGINSVTMLSFLVAVEDAFGIEWDDEVPEDVLNGFTSMAEYIQEQTRIDA